MDTFDHTVYIVNSNGYIIITIFYIIIIMYIVWYVYVRIITFVAPANNIIRYYRYYFVFTICFCLFFFLCSFNVPRSYIIGIPRPDNGFRALGIIKNIIYGTVFFFLHTHKIIIIIYNILA